MSSKSVAPETPGSSMTFASDATPLLAEPQAASAGAPPRTRQTHNSRVVTPAGIRANLALQGRSVAAASPTHRSPRLPRDAHDHERDRQTDQRVRDVETQRDHRGAFDHSEAHEGVGAGVVSVSDQRRAVEPMAGARADLRRDPVAGEPDRAREGERAEPVRR